MEMACHTCTVEPRRAVPVYACQVPAFSRCSVLGLCLFHNPRTANIPVSTPRRKVKNSWGDSWGQGGYILLERADSEEEEGGQCGLLIEAIYPILGTPEEDADAAAEFAFEAAEMIGMSEAEREALWTLVDPSDVAERPVGFQSSASAKDCGGGTSDVVFHDGEERFCFVRDRGVMGAQVQQPVAGRVVG